MKSRSLWNWIERLDSTNSTVETAEILAEMIERSDEPHHDVRLLTGDLFEDFERDLGVGKKSVRKALGRVYGDGDWQAGRRNELEKELGDLSLAVEQSEPENQSLTIPVDADSSTLLDELDELERIDGSNDKIDKIVGMLQKYTEPHVTVFAITNDRSFGVSWKTVVNALSICSQFSEQDLKRAYGLNPDCGRLVYDAVEMQHLDLSMSPFKRIAPMLATSADEQRETDIYQTKYDGSRLLVHQGWNGSELELRAFSRQQHEITESIPELQDQPWPNTTFVADAEAVAYDDGNVLNFQEIMKRFGREHDVDEMMEDIAVEFKIFDCLFYSSVDLTKYEYYKRWEHVENGFDSSLHARTSENEEEIMAWSLENGHEGIIVKDMESAYVFDRDRAWRKVKADPETADLLVTDEFEAEGKLRRKLQDEYGQTGIGSVAISTADGVPLGNVGTGFKEHERVELWGELEGSIIEVEFDELQEGQNEGYGLRFPRFIRVREADADSLDRLKQL